ncbi:MAG: helix-turn-helix transcriptional regulator, partial [Luteimonas sp.]|nr:helix-turn-helix transcriptional regulator [Luteimonas sp.]
RLPPLPQLVPLIAAGEAARDAREREAFEELSLRLAGAVIALLAGIRQADTRPSHRDEKRISDALRRIAAQSHERLALAELAGEAAMSRYHFLRTFRHVVGMTPHQFILRTRLHRAAVRLRRSDEAISDIAVESGFDDLSTFNRRFRRIAGMSPGAYRTRTGGPRATPVALAPFER